MPFTFTMPKLSPTMEEGTIAKWLKKEGEFVQAGDVLLEVTTDKATVEHSVLDEGWLRKILVPEGKLATVNQPIAIFTAEKTESIEGYQPKTVAAPKKTAESPKAEELPGKVAAEVTAPVQTRSGALQQPAFVPEAPLKGYAFEYPSESIGKRVLASPLARKLAADRGLDLSTVKGSGPHQRIVATDLERAQPSAAVAFGRREAPDVAPGTYEEEALSPMRKVIGLRLQEAKSFIPHIYVTMSIDADALVSTREQLNGMGIKVTVNDFIIRACALTLREHMNFNSGFNSVNNTLIRFKTIDIAVAVSLPEGLITPIIRHADYKNLGEISLEVRSLAKRAKEGKLDPTEYKGGSFTLTNLGMFGVTEFQAIINPPQAGILAIGSILDIPVVKNGQVVPGKVMNVTLSADHRVVDGAKAAEFLKSLQKYLENPASLLI